MNPRVSNEAFLLNINLLLSALYVPIYARVHGSSVLKRAPANALSQGGFTKTKQKYPSLKNTVHLQGKMSYIPLLTAIAKAITRFKHE